jgi:hypothetical protein
MLGLSFRLFSTTSLSRGRGFSPLSLFANSEPGLWLDLQAADLDWRRNLLRRTEELENADWSRNAVTVSIGSVVIPTAANSVHELLVPSFTVVSGQTYTLSSEVEAAGYNFLQIVFSSNATGSGGTFRNFNLSTGATGQGNTVGQSITSLGGGRYRIAVSFVADGTGTALVFFSPRPDDGARRATFAGDETSGVFVTKAQIELGSVATDYQPITDGNTELRERFPQATLYTDTSGTTPATWGNAVALALDKSRGLVLGSELAAGFAYAALAGTLPTPPEGGFVVRRNSDSTQNWILRLTGLTVGRVYRISFTATADALEAGNNASILATALGGTENVHNIGGPGTYTVHYSPTTSNDGGGSIRFQANNNQSFVVSNISVRELPGNHATQATTASRPILGREPFGGRRNLLTFTEQFDNAFWTKTDATVTANAAAAPDGTTTADTLIENATTGGHNVLVNFGGSESTAYSLSIYAKMKERRYIAVGSNLRANTGAYVAFDLQDGVAGSPFGSGSAAVSGYSITSVGDGWYRCVVNLSGTTGGVGMRYATAIVTGLTPTPAAALNPESYTGDGTSGLFIWGAQLELGSTATAYQKVVTAFDVTEAGVPSVAYLSFDGVDDGMSTGTITPGTDKAQVFAGVRKLSDAVSGALIESSGSSGANNGVVAIFAPTSTTANYFFRSKGTLSADNTALGFAAPTTNVITGLGDISGDTSTLRVNGTQVAQSTADQGTGDYLAYPLFIGSRNNVSNRLNGRIYSLTVRFGPNLDADTIARAERFAAAKTGIVI